MLHVRLFTSFIYYSGLRLFMRNLRKRYVQYSIFYHHIYIYFKIQLISLHFSMKKGSIRQGRVVSIFKLDSTIIFIS